MVFFRNKAEFFKKIDFLLENESMREKIGLNGFNVVNKKHDSLTRVEEIIKTWK
jgi:spore maturation protein CgeB